MKRHVFLLYFFSFFAMILMPPVLAGQLLGVKLTNASGNLLQSGDGANRIENKRFHLAGILKKSTDRQGYHNIKNLNALGSPIQFNTLLADGSNSPYNLVTNNSFDPKTHRLRSIEQAGYQNSYQYLTNGSLAVETIIHARGARYQYHQFYDPYQGHLLNWRDQAGKQNKVIQYHALGVKQSSFLNHLGQAEMITQGYDVYGRKTGVVHQNGLAQTRQYNIFGQVSDLIISSKGGSQLDYHYDYDVNGNLKQTQLTSHVVGQVKKMLTTQYSYNRLNQLIRYQATQDSDVSLLPTDRYNHFIQAQTFSYTPNGSIAQINSDFIDHMGQPMAGDDAVYTYDLVHGYPDRVLSISHTNPDMLNYEKTVGGPHNYRYDANNNIEMDRYGTRYTYNPLNQLVSLNSAISDGKQVDNTYAYAADGKLAWQSSKLNNVLAPSVDYFYAGDQLIHQTQAAIKTDLIGPATVIHGGNNPQTQYMFSAHQGVGAVFNDQQHMVAQYTYSPYGLKNNIMQRNKTLSNPSEQRSALHINDNQTTYTDQQQDSSTGLLLFGGYRHFDPSAAIFIKRDSFGPFTKAGPNSFAYAQANPIKFKDPSGHFSVKGFFENVGLNTAIFGLGFIANIASPLTDGLGPVLSPLGQGSTAGSITGGLTNKIHKKSTAKGIEVGAVTGTAVVATAPILGMAPELAPEAFAAFSAGTATMAEATTVSLANIGAAVTSADLSDIADQGADDLIKHHANWAKSLLVSNIISAGMSVAMLGLSQAYSVWESSELKVLWAARKLISPINAIKIAKRFYTIYFKLKLASFIFSPSEEGLNLDAGSYFAEHYGFSDSEASDMLRTLRSGSTEDIDKKVYGRLMMNSILKVKNPMPMLTDLKAGQIDLDSATKTLISYGGGKGQSFQSGVLADLKIIRGLHAAIANPGEVGTLNNTVSSASSAIARTFPGLA